ncbi:helix-turn-helix domain-containing protein [Streptomyces sp. NBC_00078]|uniref:helix-turn-helix domain-containing protein n=1 Tax=unclassified Streptomyces TaxID=2593676 RepID=UPI0022553C43|nr:helix-turn-helix domain-containing protein [Streptomyces sp. NBC_00078]MCX5419252.1 helix-turn-helix domain-containing protein [Streptomyces sp. NBC_00078]
MGHDAFAHHALGSAALMLISALHVRPDQTATELVGTSSVPRATAYRTLQRLADHGLVRHTGETWALVPRALEGFGIRLSDAETGHTLAQGWDQVAEQHGTWGIAARRKALHTAERAAYQQALDRFAEHRSRAVQLMRKETWTGIPAKTNGQTVRPLQDEATRAWNLHTALYYKAGGTPWRMQRHSSDLATCYVGVSFYRSTSGNELHTAVAQVFNERGDGVVVRGGTAQISKTDRQPHLTVSDARQLLLDALAEYRTTHGHQPARIVVHKTSNFTTGETDGFHEAADLREIDHVDLLWIQRRGAPHLYRTGQLPPLRGTSVQLDARSLLLYTRGSVPYFRTYPGLYVPQPLLIRPATRGTDLLTAGMDILALTKMNWNNAQLDERDPLTLRTAYRVGSILRHVPAGARIATRYAYYM